VNRTLLRRIVVLVAILAAVVAGTLTAFAGGDGSTARAASTARATSTQARPAATVAAGEVIPATDSGSLANALQGASAGDTVELAAGSYAHATVNGKKGITISGPRGATLDGITITGATDVTLKGVTIAPAGDQRAEIVISRSTNVTIDGVLVDGRDEAVGAGLVADESVNGLTLRGSEVTNCGEGQRCIAADFTANVLVVGNSFHDCFSCDFIRGSSGMTIRRNTFERAVAGRCEAEGRECAHNDIIQVMGGGPWTIVGNRFGDSEGGGGALFVSLGRNNEDNPIHDVLIASNVFTGAVRHFAVNVTGDEAAPAGLISGITIVNNTILSGQTAAISLAAAWATLPEARRPLVANNVFGRLRNRDICDRGRFIANVVVVGSACTGAIRGQTALTADGAPTKASKALRDKADPRYAPKLDHSGRKRVGRPDIGAIEYRG
jgi:hypothetical protein